MSVNSNMTENFWSAIDDLVLERLSNLSYDITKTCIIIDNAKANDGKYLVEEGSSTFEAYSTGPKYEIGDSVLVNIPNGNYDEQKTIVSKKLSGVIDSQTYVSPKSQLLPIKEYKVNQDQAIKLIANYSQPVVVKGDINDYDDKVPAFVFCADVKTLLNEYNITQGNYGFIIYLFSDADKISRFTFDSSEMIGNPYGFKGYFQQSKLFEISDLNKIKSYQIAFYQRGNFQTIPTPNGNSPFNIFAKNISLSFGLLKSECKEDKVEIFTTDDFNYTNSPSDKTSNNKTIDLRWLHVEEGKNPEIVTKIDKLENKKEIRWYRFERGASASDIYCGQHWTRIEEKEENLSPENKEKKFPFRYIFSPDINKPEEQIKVICFNISEDKDIELLNGKETITRTPIYSNILVFKNDRDNEGLLEDMLYKKIRGLIFTIKRDKINESGNYFSYTQEGQLLPEFTGTRTIEAWFPPKESNENPTTIKDCDSINWTCSKDNTMINNFQPGQSQSTFSLKPTYRPTYNNNIITCTVKKDGIEYTGSIELRFGPRGTMGSNQTFFLTLDDSSMEVTAFLQNEVGDPININSDISWGWRGSTIFTIIEDPSSPSQTRKIEQKKGANLEENYSILKATINIQENKDKTRTLEAYLPIPAKGLEEASFLTGPKEVVYDVFGAPSYSKEPFNLWNSDGKKLSGITWNIYSSKKDFKDSPSLISAVGGEGKTLSVPPYFLKDELYESCLVGKKDENIIWSQPLFIWQNNYGTSMLNSWNGDLTINENNGTILSTMLSAGSKDDEYKYSGVLIGDLQKGTGNNKYKHTGVYGISKGVISYALTDDGKATFGQAGKGQIIIDGNIGVIQSGSQSMKIDLNEGTINCNNIFKVAKDGKMYCVGAEVEGKITASSGFIAGWNISSDKLLSPTVTMRLPIESGSEKPIFKDFKRLNMIHAPSSDQYATMIAIGVDADDYNDGKPDKNHTGTFTSAPFRVDAKGRLYSTEAEIKGKITANEGSIAGWDIYSNKLQSPTMNNRFNMIHAPSPVGTDFMIAFGVNAQDYENKKTYKTAPFKVDGNGKLFCEGAEIEGKITASDGSIAGWDIYSNRLQSPTIIIKDSTETFPDKKCFNMIHAPSSNMWSNMIAIGVDADDYAATSEYTSAPFRVNAKGTLYCKGAEIEGKITASRGSIAGWNIFSDKLQSPAVSIDGINRFNMIHAPSPDGTDYMIAIGVNAQDYNNGVEDKEKKYSGTYKTAPFKVNGNGKLFCEDISVSGGSISGSSISGGSINISGSFKANSTTFRFYDWSFMTPAGVGFWRTILGAAEEWAKKNPPSKSVPGT